MGRCTDLIGYSCEFFSAGGVNGHVKMMDLISIGCFLNPFMHSPFTLKREFLLKLSSGSMILLMIT